MMGKRKQRQWKQVNMNSRGGVDGWQEKSVKAYNVLMDIKEWPWNEKRWSSRQKRTRI